MNVSIVKTLTAGKRIGLESDSPRELIPVLVERPALDEDEFDLRGYIRNLEDQLNDPETPNEDFYWILDRIEFLGGTISWEPQYLDGTDETAFVNF